ncbi:hypothetical protein BZG36_03427 [Bifiguratus adelaidae]|uniref:Major facilitator superfamily associated domain-containing protein n=1 Tax=Bifiguratus adelaidae TaxID=1938954 RepID=A0A261XYS2_9FUNG|nr:hypothetical protein BZG36_03427 [Bifiguratus adelaidae]
MAFVLPKLLYAAYYIQMGSAPMYLPLFYDQGLALASSQVGALLAIAPFIQAFACPLWTLVVDKKPHWHGRIMALCVLVGGASVSILMFLPSWLHIKQTRSGKQDISGAEDNAQTTTMVIACGLVGVYALFALPVAALIDSAVLKILGPYKLLYGNQRLWGSIAWGLTVLTVGLLMGWTNNNLAMVFYVYDVGCILFCCFAVFTRFDTKQDVLIFDVEGDDYDEVASLLRPDDEANLKYQRYLEEQRQKLKGSIRNGSVFSTRTYGSRASIYFQEPEATIGSYGAVQHTHLSPEDGEHPASCAHPYDQDYLAVHHRPSEETESTLPDWSPGQESISTASFRGGHTRRISILSITPTLRDEVDAFIDDQHDIYPTLGLALSRIPSLDASMGALALPAELSSRRTASIKDSMSIIMHPQEDTPAGRISVFLFLAMVLVFGTTYAMINNFLFLYMVDHLKAEAVWLGWTGPVSGILELTMFWGSRAASIITLQKRFGATKLIVLAHVLTILRCLAYTVLAPSQLTSKCAALGLQAANGIAYGLLWSTAVNEVDTFFPPHQRAVAQGILAALFAGLGAGLGSFVGGWVYGLGGGVALYRVAAGLASASLTLFLGRTIL